MRLECHAQPCAQLVISIHAPQWGATCLSDGHVADLIISIHAPQWGATHRRWTGESLSLNFNPRTPVGCDNLPTVGLGHLVISIHAPQWGATYGRGQRRAGQGISIHAPQWGATEAFDKLTPELEISIHAPQWGATDRYVDAYTGLRFQSTHPSGVRPILLASVLVPAIISIHAPQWGATLPSNRAAISLSFQSTHPSGVRRLCPFVLGSFEIFQSTHPSGVRRSDTANIPPCANISIHAPQWGATHVGVHYGRSVFVQ